MFPANYPENAGDQPRIKRSSIWNYPSFFLRAAERKSHFPAIAERGKQEKKGFLLYYFFQLFNTNRLMQQRTRYFFANDPQLSLSSQLCCSLRTSIERKKGKKKWKNSRFALTFDKSQFNEDFVWKTAAKDDPVLVDSVDSLYSSFKQILLNSSGLQ